MNVLRAFGRFWWEFVVGDEWRLAVVVGVASILGALAALGHLVSGEVIACGVAAGVMLAASDVIISTGRRRARRSRDV
jgi:hypothetical protein